LNTSTKELLQIAGELQAALFERFLKNWRSHPYDRLYRTRQAPAQCTKTITLLFFSD